MGPTEQSTDGVLERFVLLPVCLEDRMYFLGYFDRHGRDCSWVVTGNISSSHLDHHRALPRLEVVGFRFDIVIVVYFELALTDEDITIHGDGEQTRDFVFVGDLVQANRLAAETGAIGESYNIGTDESISIPEPAELLQKLTETDSEIVHTEPRDVISTVSRRTSKRRVSCSDTSLLYPSKRDWS